MGVESSKVEIKIGVVDDGASATIGAVTSKVEGLGAAGAMTGQKIAQATAGMAGGMNGAAAAATAFSTRMKSAMDAYEAQSARGLKVQEFLGAQFDKFSANNPAVVAFERAAAAASQFTPEVERAGAAGVRMGAAYGEARVAMGAMTGSSRMMAMGLANIGSRLSWMAPLWEAALPVALGVGMISLIAQMGEGVYHLYEKWFDVDGAIEQYNEKASEAAEKKFYANSGVDELAAGLRAANGQIDELNQKKAASPSWSEMMQLSAAAATGGTQSALDLSHGAGSKFTVHDAAALNQARGHSDADRLKLLDEIHARNVQQIQDEAHLREAGMRNAEARAAQEKAATVALARENELNRVAGQQLLHEISSRPQEAKPGEKGYHEPVPAPSADAGTMKAATGRINSLATMEPGYTGQAEYDLAVKHSETQYQIARRQEAVQASDEIRRLDAQAAEAGLTGLKLIERQKIDALEEFDRRMRRTAASEAQIARGRADIEKAVAVKVTGYWQQQEDAFDKMAAAAMDAAAKQQDAQDEFAQRVDQLGAESRIRGATGVARILAERDAQLKQFDAEAAMRHARPEDVARGEQYVRNGAAQQIAAEQERVRQQTEDLEAQARSRRLSSERSQTGAITAEYDQRLAKFNEELHRQEIGWDDYNRRVVAAGELRDSQLADAARQSRERMAGQFSGFFRSLDHPLLALASMGDKVGGQAAAALMQRFQNHYAGAHGSGPLSADFSPHAILDRIAGTARPNSGAIPELASSSAAARMIAVTTAHIQVGSASIGFGGGAGAPGSSPGTVGMGAIGAPGAFPVSGVPAGTVSTGRAGGILYDVNQNAVAIPGMAGAVPVSSGGTGAGAWSAGTGAYASAGTPGSFSSSGSTAGGAGAGSQGAGIQGAAMPPGPYSPNRAGAVLGDVGAGMTLFQQGRSIFGAKPGLGSGTIDTTSVDLGGTFNKNGVWQAGGSTNGGMLGGGGFANNAMGAAGGALGMWSAYEGNGGVGGALGGAMSGMQLGMALGGGPLGAGIGLAAGAIVGAIGFGGREKARVYDLRQVRPHIAADMQQMETGGDYLGLYGDLQTLDVTAERTTKQWGPSAHGYYNDVIREEIGQARGRLDQMAKAGRADFGLTKGQYATGTDFVPETGPYTLHRGESVFTATERERTVRALEASAAPRRIPAQAAGAWSGDIHIHTIDAKGVKQFLDQNKHLLRSALNQSYAENSGGADAGF
jgi:hypothetical protein